MPLLISDAEVKQAQLPHNLMISGLFGFNLLMAPAVIALKTGMAGLLIPLLSTGALIGYIYWRSQKTTSPFVDMHWQLAFKNSRWLLLGYAITAALVLLGWLISLSAKDASMGHIIWTALTRIAILPTLAGVMVTAIMEAGAISQASRQHLPADQAANAPPPVIPRQ